MLKKKVWILKGSDTKHHIVFFDNDVSIKEALYIWKRSSYYV